MQVTYLRKSTVTHSHCFSTSPISKDVQYFVCAVVPVDITVPKKLNLWFFMTKLPNVPINISHNCFCFSLCCVNVFYSKCSYFFVFILFSISCVIIPASKITKSVFQLPIIFIVSNCQSYLK